ncbi:MAG TPA: M23 family metallopeptidase [Vicinamibacterales bacterium]
MRKFLALLVLLLLVAAAVWFAAGRASGPSLTIVRPEGLVGQVGELEVVVETPGGALTALNVALEQDGTRVPLFSLPGDETAKLVQVDDRRVTLTRPIGRKSIPQLKQGKARIIVEATRPVLFGYREVSSSVTKDVEVRLTPPRVGVLSRHHFINHGGSEMVVYQVSPADAQSGVRVGDHVYPGFPARGAGIAGAPDGMMVAFFALLYDQDLNTPISVFARDAAGNEGRATFDYRVFPRNFRRSRIEIDDRFLSRVVPAILENTPDLQVNDPSNLLESFLTINRDLRRQNNDRIASLAAKSAPEILWQGPFRQLTNSAVESGFADHRTYLYKGEEVDRQVHLGFDLASLAAAPVQAANAGRVVLAEYLGIYGNCVILDHGMGLQSLYAHLSTIDVQVGQEVAQGQTLGRSGATGLAGGDHLHFTMLLGGQAVTPIDWWSAQWVQDRIVRKIQEASATGAPSSATARSAR